MTRDEVYVILDIRHGLTGQASNAKVIDAWYDALANVNYATARDALRQCARTCPRIAIPDLLAAMPRREADTHHEPTYTGPIIPFEEGIKIAYAACVDELISQGATREDALHRAARLVGRLGDDLQLGDPF